MHILYHHFIQKIKDEEIQKYNQKHQAYLIRAGKLKPDGLKMYKNNENKNILHNQGELNEQKNKNFVPTKKEDNRPKRQRQFVRPHKNVQKDEKQKQINTYGPKSMQLDKPININRNEKPEENYTQQFHYQAQMQNKQFKQDDRPIKSNKLTKQQQQYIEQTKNQKNQFQSSGGMKIQKQQKTKNLANQRNTIVVYEFKQDQLIQCESCNRKFRPQVIAKHQKNCQKVFLEKRKPFQTKRTDEEAKLLKSKSDISNNNEEKVGKKTAKWKKDSDQLRNIVKRGRGAQAELVEIEDDRIKCPGCGRKFNQTAAQRHITFCTTKNKKI